MSKVVFRGLASRINDPANEVSAGFSVSFGLDFVWRNHRQKENADDKSYYPTVLKSSNKIQVRLEMLRYTKKFGISAAARLFGTTRVTVRK